MIHSDDFSDGDLKVFNSSVITGIMERYNNNQSSHKSYIHSSVVKSICTIWKLVFYKEPYQKRLQNKSV